MGCFSKTVASRSWEMIILHFCDCICVQLEATGRRREQLTEVTPVGAHKDGQEPADHGV